MIAKGQLPLLDPDSLTFPPRFWPPSLAEDAQDARDAAHSAGVSAASAAAPISRESWAGEVTLDLVPGGLIRATLTGDTTVTLPVLDPGVAASFLVRVEQDTTGGHSLTFPGCAVAEGFAYESTADPGAVDVLTCLWDGEAWTVFVGATYIFTPIGWVI